MTYPSGVFPKPSPWNTSVSSETACFTLFAKMKKNFTISLHNENILVLFILPLQTGRFDFNHLSFHSFLLYSTIQSPFASH